MDSFATTIGTTKGFRASRFGWYFESCHACKLSNKSLGEKFECACGVTDVEPVIKFKLEMEVEYDDHEETFVFGIRIAGEDNPKIWPAHLDVLLNKEMVFRIKYQLSYEQFSIVAILNEDKLYQNFDNYLTPNEQTSNVAVLEISTAAPTVHTTQMIKNVVASKNGEEKKYFSSDCIYKSNATNFDAYEHVTPEFLNALKTLGLPNHSIRLKVRATIMLMRNLDQSEGLCNGTRLTVTRLAAHVIEAKIIYGKNIGNTIYIPRMSLSPSQSPWPFKLVRRQFPIIIFFAMTINKSQGQSLDQVGLYLPKELFSHGQLYEAL
ncbi:uncharacterized protein LOC131624206 [Vicia villosa]|uniref:uncharacterized protein LOC131624206 n=1 Tax=Vicia villosa TaxID=3911 RepID=UPI00273B964C|nr:uncharacterized protein LOC131624206 [Vicia villosa]